MLSLIAARPAVVVVAVFCLAPALSGCVAASVAGAAVGVTAAAVGTTAKVAGVTADAAGSVGHAVVGGGAKPKR